MRRALLSLLVVAIATLPAAAGGSSARSRADLVEVVVTLPSPPLSAAPRTAKLQSATWGRGIDAEQRSFEGRLRATIPTAYVRWRYRITLNGLAVVLPRRDLLRLTALAGTEQVYPNVRYRARLDTSPGLIGAPQLWGAGLATAGQGIKIGIIDDGVDQTHPFFSPAGYAYPPGYPKGQRAFTTPKVIAARAFAPPNLTAAIAPSRDGGKPFDPGDSFHGTHVAGIAAGNPTRADVGGRTRMLSGVAPKAYIGNYKALGVPTSDFGLDGNAPEIAAAIEAAVADGMNVINLSLGEPEIEPSRDLVVQAINGAADAGVVPVIAAGNEFEQFGSGSIGSPGTAEKAITVAAAAKDGHIAGFSSGGPTPVSLGLKPDLTAPGVGIVSSLPRDQGLWGALQGTSMASPHVAGAAALLRERHATWTVEEIKSALVQTGARVFEDASRSAETQATREGGGLVDLTKADRPLLFARPSSVSFGLLRAGQTVARSVSFADAGGGAAAWTVTVAPQTADPAVTIVAPATVPVPGALELTATAGPGARGLDLTGFIVLTRGADVRRIPYWLSVTQAVLATEPNVVLSRPGIHRGDTRGKPSLVSAYRYPRANRRLAGPEQVFRVTVAEPVANFGVAILSGPPGIEPRIVYAGDEAHLVGWTALPLHLNPYTRRWGERIRVAGAIRPAAGAYDVVFDTSGTAGTFTFRYWIDDVTPPRVRLLTPRARAEGKLRFTASDAGAGVDPASVVLRVDGRLRPTDWDARRRQIVAPLAGLRPGKHRLVVLVSDYQESKNMENVPPILPNTATLRASFVLR